MGSLALVFKPLRPRLRRRHEWDEVAAVEQLLSVGCEHFAIAAILFRQFIFDQHSEPALGVGEVQNREWTKARMERLDGHAVGVVRFHASRFMTLDDDSPPPVLENELHDDALS